MTDASFKKVSEKHEFNGAFREAPSRAAASFPATGANVTSAQGSSRPADAALNAAPSTGSAASSARGERFSGASAADARP